MSARDIDLLRDQTENQLLVEQLQHCIGNAPRNIDTLRGTLAEILQRHAWADRFDNRLDREVRFNAIVDFITAPLLEGLGSDVETIRRLLAGTPELVDLEQALARGRGGNNNPEGLGGRAGKTADRADAEGEIVNHDIVMVDKEATPTPTPPPTPEQGNAVAYAIRRLSAQRPDLLERVKAGEMSANAAMIEAGFRKVPTVLDILRKAWAKASDGERQSFLSEIGVGDCMGESHR